MRKYWKLIIVCILFLYAWNVYAYTKEDIINLASSIESCSSETKALINGAKASYTRLLNERNVSSANLNKIYNNINKVKTILDKYSLCSVEQESKIPDSVKTTLYNLYYETNEIILSSPKITDNSKSESNIVVDNSNKEIKIYEDGALSEVIKLEEKLNYVGLNKTLIVLIIVSVLLLIVTIVLKFIKKDYPFSNSVVYVLVFLLLFMFVFRNPLSLVLDAISLMNVNIQDKEREVVTNGEKIIAYPLYGNKYAQIYINKNSGDVYFGDSKDILKKGIGHDSTSYLPGEGNKTILSGHNTGIFKELFSLKKGSKVIIETIYGEFTYVVQASKVVKDTEVDVLKSDYDLIMYTCYPNKNLYGNQRLIVYANLLESKWIGESNEE